MTILTVVKDVCAAVGVALPGSVFASLNANRTMQEMLALANEMAQRIAYDTRDWQMLMKSVTFTGDGHWVPPLPPPVGVTSVWTGTSEFTLPADYRRMLLNSNVRRSTDANQPMRFISDYDEWLWRRAQAVDDGRGEWIIVGGRMIIWPVMAGFIPAVPAAPPVPATPAVPAVTATFPYLERNCITLASGGYGDRFMADGDLFRLDERILKLGMIWQWKALKGSPYAEDMGTYSDAIATAMGKDKPSPIIIGRLPSSHGVRVSGPWPAGWGPLP